MRFQEKIYNQTGRCVRNRDILNVNTSSDICTFAEPRFGLSGATSMDWLDSVTIKLSTNLLLSVLDPAATNCSLSATSCVEYSEWTLKVLEDDVEVYSDLFYTISGSSVPPQSSYYAAVSGASTTLGYSFILDDNILTMYKPFGITGVSFDICVNITGSTACTTSACSEYCFSSDLTFPILSSASTGVYLVDNVNDVINLTFDFTANTTSFTDTTLFKYEIYKYNHTNLIFEEPAVYKSVTFEYSSFSATSAITESIPFSSLQIDGEYIVKGYFEYDLCTDILGKLGLRNDSSLHKYGTVYGLFNPSFDYYFAVVREAAEPLIAGTVLPTDRAVGGLGAHSVLLTSGQTQYLIETEISGDILIYYNGLMLAEGLDYTLSGNLVTFVVSAISGDVLTYVSVSDSMRNGLVVDNIDVTSITSGVTGNEGSALTYYNTDYGKYEIYTILTPVNFNDVVVTLNGVTLAPNIDYYQSISNPKRIILEGTIMVGDVINIIYNAWPSYVGEIYTNTPTIYWTIPSPQLNNGHFTVQVSTDKTFTNIVSSATTDYVAGQSAYSAQITLTGSVGTDLIYRVRNDKNYVTLNGDTIDSVAYSEVVPITIMSNAINSY